MQLGDDTVGTVALGDSIRVRRLGFGAARIARTPGFDRADGRRLVQRAVERGVNFIDVAALYGGGECEAIIAEALDPFPDDVVVASKTGFVPAAPVEHGQAWPRPDGRPEVIRSTCEDSLRRLRRERIDVYQLHGPDPAVPFEDTIGAFAALREEGKVGEVGLSNVTVEQLETAERIVPIVSVQNRYTPVDRQDEPMLRACEARGIAYVPWSPNLVGDPEAAAVLAAIAADHGVSQQQVGVRWLLAHSPLVLAIPGTTQLGHLDDNVDLAWLELDDDEVRRIDEAA